MEQEIFSWKIQPIILKVFNKDYLNKLLVIQLEDLVLNYLGYHQTFHQIISIKISIYKIRWWAELLGNNSINFCHKKQKSSDLVMWEQEQVEFLSQHYQGQLFLVYHQIWLIVNFKLIVKLLLALMELKVKNGVEFLDQVSKEQKNTQPFID